MVTKHIVEKSRDYKVREAISLSLRAGYHLDKEAYGFLRTISGTKDPVEFLEVTLRRLEAYGKRTFFIDKALLEEIAEEIFPQAKEARPSAEPYLQKHSASTGKARRYQPHAKDIDSDINVIDDPTDRIRSTGSIEEYLKYFQDRFKKTRRLLQQRMDSRNATSIKEVFRAPPHSKTKFICIVTEKRESPRGVFLITEDLETGTTVFIPSNAPPELLLKTKSILPDQVVCLSIIKGRGNLLIVEDIHFPDIPQRKPRRAQEAVSAALISDLHVGSREFMREEFNRFLLWLNGKFGPQKLKEAASLIKYVIIAGDIVDGVGIYPNQIEDLTIRDISRQYRVASEFIEQIPDYVELIIIPGNHDASRKALPQPSLPKEYVEILRETRNVLSLGNPATVSIHGVELLTYHGRSLDDILATAVNMDFHSPERAMKLMLKCRHLAPIYGQRTPIAPANRDLLVIDRVPDIFHTGHVHVMRYETYRGTIMINSGAWQRQTNFQRNLGLEPTPGVIPIIDLQTHAILPIDFNA
ncbi:DNA-directed DNA polymerase II small subunit [Candidatus Bathyarchaeota archaeon]|nr:DNA-directed DNA polymerase II small subunit [Candidatus Bathyarchaeota archaeon]